MRIKLSKKDGQNTDKNVLELICKRLDFSTELYNRARSYKRPECVIPKYATLS
jgi:hypothetical protein